MSTNNQQPFIIISFLTEEVGHLLKDDIFWFSSLIKIDGRTTIYTSQTSTKNLIKSFPDKINNFIPFKDIPFLQKINYRLFYIHRILRIKPVQDSIIIIQAFDLLFFLF